MVRDPEVKASAGDMGLISEVAECGFYESDSWSRPAHERTPRREASLDQTPPRHPRRSARCIAGTVLLRLSSTRGAGSKFTPRAGSTWSTVRMTAQLDAARSYVAALLSHDGDSVPYAPNAVRYEMGLKDGPFRKPPAPQPFAWPTVPGDPRNP